METPEEKAAREKREKEEREQREKEERERQERERSQQKPPWGKDDEFNPERAWKLIQDLRGDLDKVKSDRDELRDKVGKHEDASKSETQRLEERATNAEQRAAAAEADVARYRVALKKG